MTFATNTALKAAIADYIARSDLTTQIVDAVTLCESRIYYGSDDPTFGSEPLRIRAMEATADITIDAQTETLPTRFLGARRIYLNTSPIGKLDFLPPMDFWAKYVSSTTGQPTAFTIEGENWTFGPSPDATYTGKALYYNSFAALSAGGDTNWLLTNAPGAYLYGALVELGLLIQDEATVARWIGPFRGVIGGLNRSDKRDRFSGAPLVMRADSGNP